MIRGAFFTIGTLLGLGSLGWGILSVMAAGMSDAPGAADDEASSGLWTAGIGLAVGGAICLVAWLA